MSSSARPVAFRCRLSPRRDCFLVVRSFFLPGFSRRYCRPDRAAGRACCPIPVARAYLAGLNPQRTTFGVFVSMGVLAGLAAVMNVMQSPQVQPTCGDGLELKVIAAAVVGGVAVSGGRGSLWGVFPGLLLLANVNPALTHFHVQAYWEKAIQGFVILLAVMADGLRSKRK